MAHSGELFSGEWFSGERDTIFKINLVVLMIYYNVFLTFQALPKLFKLLLLMSFFRQQLFSLICHNF